MSNTYRDLLLAKKQKMIEEALNRVNAKQKNASKGNEEKEAQQKAKEDLGAAKEKKREELMEEMKKQKLQEIERTHSLAEKKTIQAAEGGSPEKKSKEMSPAELKAAALEKLKKRKLEEIERIHREEALKKERANMEKAKSAELAKAKQLAKSQLIEKVEKENQPKTNYQIVEPKIKSGTNKKELEDLKRQKQLELLQKRKEETLQMIEKRRGGDSPEAKKSPLKIQLPEDSSPRAKTIISAADLIARKQELLMRAKKQKLEEIRLRQERDRQLVMRQFEEEERAAKAKGSLSKDKERDILRRKQEKEAELQKKFIKEQKAEVRRISDQEKARLMKERKAALLNELKNKKLRELALLHEKEKSQLRQDIDKEKQNFASQGALSKEKERELENKYMMRAHAADKKFDNQKLRAAKEAQEEAEQQIAWEDPKENNIQGEYGDDEVDLDEIDNFSPSPLKNELSLPALTQSTSAIYTPRFVPGKSRRMTLPAVDINPDGGPVRIPKGYVFKFDDFKVSA